MLNKNKRVLKAPFYLFIIVKSFCLSQYILGKICNIAPANVNWHAILTLKFCNYYADTLQTQD